MTGRRRRVFPIAIALVATTLAGCTAQDAPFGIGVTGYDTTRPDAARGFGWRRTGTYPRTPARTEVTNTNSWSPSAAVGEPRDTVAGCHGNRR